MIFLQYQSSDYRIDHIITVLQRLNNLNPNKQSVKIVINVVMTMKVITFLTITITSLLITYLLVNQWIGFRKVKLVLLRIKALVALAGLIQL